MRYFDLIPSGGLNRDVDVNSLPQGDYVNAKNIITSVGKGGGGASIKILESIKDVGIPTITGLEKATFDNSDGFIYQLFRTDINNAAIYRISPTLNSRVLVLSYPHAVDTDFTPDLKIIGNTIVWNYHSVGTLLYWSLDRTDGDTVTIEDLLLAKSPPVNALSVVKNISSGNGIDLLENFDFQFSCRYKYDTGEYSVLGNSTNMFKGEKDTASYTISFSLTGKPVYATELHVYSRIGKSGTWKRIQTIDVSGGTASNLTWKGDAYETLDTKSSIMQFSAIPASVKNIEIAADRVWLANFNDDYNDDSVGELVITPNTGYAIPTGGTIKNYFGGDTTTAGIKSSENGTYYKPFANNSSYSVGIVLFDSAMKTRGVQFVTNFKTGNFLGPVAPSFSITSTGYTKPSYVKYMQLCISENLTKGFIYEGFANSLYFQLLVGDEVQYKLSITSSDLSNLTYAILDVSGMFKSGIIYSFNDGDRITLSCPNGLDEGVTDGDGSKTGGYRLIDTEIVGSDGDKIYLEWNGGECLNDAIPDPTKLYFEIYSPKQQSEDDNLLFYGVGNVIDITSSIPSTITDYTVGDMVFKTVAFPIYTDQLLLKGLQRSNPPIITPNTKTVANITKLSSSAENVLVVNSILTSRTVKAKLKINFSGLGVNGDSASIENGGLKVYGFYDSNSTITITPSYTIERIINSSNSDVFVNFKIFGNLEKLPFNIETNSYDAPVPIGQRTLMHESNLFQTTASDTAGEFTQSSFVFDFSNQESILNSGDIIFFYIEAQVTCSDNTTDVALLRIKEKVGETTSISIDLTGDRIEPVDRYTKRLSVDTATENTVFAIRSVGNGNTGEWNTSGGKPYVQQPKVVSSSRSNAIRHGGNLVYGADQNNISQFFALDTVEVPRENGDIMSLQRATRLQGEGDMLLAVCQNEASYILLGETRAIQSNNSSFSGLTSNIIGTVRNLGEQTGIQDKSSIYNHNGNIYWWDNFRNILVAFTKGRFDIISDRKMKSDFVSRSGVAKFAYDPFYDILFVKVGATPTVGFSAIGGYFNSEFDIDFTSAIHYGERCLYFFNGKIYRSLESESGNKVGEYMGVAYDSYIDLTANTIQPIYPKSIRINHSMDVISGVNPTKIKDNLLEFLITNENGQETTILENNFVVQDNKIYAHVLRDENSLGGIVNGNYIRGYNNNFRLKLKDKTQNNRIFGIEIGFDKVNLH